VGDALDARGRCTLALPGGATPVAVFRRLAGPALRRQVNWSGVEIVWVDERCVPPDHPDSNYGLAERELLGHLPGVRAHRIRGELPDAAAAAQDYEGVVAEVCAPRQGTPRLDVVWLGMGGDGHVASLFPGQASAQWEAADVVPVAPPPAAPHPRVSMTPRLLNDCGVYLCVVAGRAKRGALASLLDDPTPRASHPATLIRPRGSVEWLVDREAAPT
jgi:6-phosphogluconolactonase